VQVLNARFERDTHNFGCLTKLHQIGTITNYIVAFDKLAIHTKGQTNSFFGEYFINDLKKAIRAHVMMQCPQKWLEACDRAKEAKIAINAKIKRHVFTTCPNPPPSTTPTHPTYNQITTTNYLLKRWKNVNTLVFAIIVMIDI
jgi:hypothetical protein